MALRLHGSGRMTSGVVQFWKYYFAHFREKEYLWGKNKLFQSHRMNTLHVPNRNISPCETVFDKMKMLLEEGAKAPIDQVNWKEQFPKLLPVTVSVAHDGEQLYLCYSVRGERVRAVNTDDFAPVWQDSCVEFFMQREGENTYRNFECNILGALLASHHETRERAEKLSGVMRDIVRRSVVTPHYESNRQVTDWLLYLEIPKRAMGFAVDESLSGQSIRANFYKCGDETEEPHYLSWSPIDLPTPDFHVPQFFGILLLE